MEEGTLKEETAVAQKTIILDEESSAILAKLLEEKCYSDETTAISQAFRLLRNHNDEYKERMDLLRWEIEKGFASGIVEGNPFERLREKLGLPARVAH